MNIATELKTMLYRTITNPPFQLELFSDSTPLGKQPNTSSTPLTHTTKDHQ